VENRNPWRFFCNFDDSTGRFTSNAGMKEMSGMEFGQQDDTRDIRQALGREYDMGELCCTIRGREFRFACVQDSYALLDRISPEEFARDEQMPYWAEIWPSSIVLAEHLSGMSDLPGCAVIELGAGVGVASVVAAACGARVTATDYCTEALRFMKLNALQNGVELAVRHLDWRSITEPKQYHMLIAADVLYERQNLLPVLESLDALLLPEGEAWIADPRRRLAEQFLDLAFENGFAVSTRAGKYSQEGHETQVNLYRVARSRGGL